MRIVFKRPAQFPLDTGELSRMYQPDVEHVIPEAEMAQIEKSLLFRQLRGAGDAIIVKETAPSPVVPVNEPVEKPRATVKNANKAQAEK